MSSQEKALAPPRAIARHRESSRVIAGHWAAESE
jgi:hypothetical protein